MSLDNDKLQEEETIAQEAAMEMGASPKKKMVRWKSIALGQAIGVLLGAGIVHVARRHDADDVAETASEDAPDDTMVDVISGDDSLPFEQVVADAREIIGDNGVVTWRGGVYATCSHDEWMAKTETERQTLTQQVSTEIPVNDIEVMTPAEETMSSPEEVEVVVQQEGCTLGDDGYVHVTDSEGHDYIYVDNERVDISYSDDVSVVSVDEDSAVAQTADVLDTDGQVIDVVDNVDDIDMNDDVVVVADDDTATDDNAVGFDGNELFAEPMAFPIDDDMVSMQTEGFNDDGLMQMDILPLDNSFYNDGPVVDGPMLDTR